MFGLNSKPTFLYSFGGNDCNVPACALTKSQGLSRTFMSRTIVYVRNISNAQGKKSRLEIGPMIGESNPLRTDNSKKKEEKVLLFSVERQCCWIRRGKCYWPVQKTTATVYAKKKQAAVPSFCEKTRGSCFQHGQKPLLVPEKKNTRNRKDKHKNCKLNTAKAAKSRSQNPPRRVSIEQKTGLI